MSLDDELRRRLQEAADRAGAGADPATITQQVAKQTAVGARPPLRLLGAIGAAGLVAGGVLGFTALKPDDSNAVATQIQVQQYSLYDCPGGAAAGIAYPGDRVYVTGRNEAGDWLELRDPRQQATSRWVPADAVDPDVVAGVPVRSCTQDVSLLAEGATTTTETTTTSTVPETTTTVPATTVPATVPPIRNQPPVIGNGTATPNIIAGLTECGPSASSFAVSVTDPTGVASVRTDWSMPNWSGEQTAGSVLLVPSGNVYSGSIGPNNNPSGSGAFVTITVTATDSQGLKSIRVFTKSLFVDYCLF